VKNVYPILAALSLVFLQAGCAPEVGSDEWCENMVKTDKGDWSTNDATEFAQSCIFKSYDD